VVLEKGVWKKGKTIYDVIDGLKEGDVIIKGANCVDMTGARAGILIGHPKGGTILTVLQAVVGRRVRLVLPVGLEKRIADDIDDVAAVLNAPGSTGLRLMPVAGEIITEITAVENMFIAAHALGLGARIYTGPVANVNANLKVELEIPAGHRAVALLRVGAVDKPVDAVTAASGRRAVSETVNYSRVR